MKIYKQSLLACSLTISVLLSGCQSEEKKKQVQPKESMEATVLVAKEEVKPNQLQFTARILPQQQAKISTKLMGHVQSVLVEEGQQVDKGQLLVRLDNRDLQAKRAQIKAQQTAVASQLRGVEKDYERISRLYKKQSASEKEMDDIRTAFESIKAQQLAVDNQLVEIDQLLSYSRLKAPFSGIVTKKFMNEGDLASPGMPVIAMEGKGEFKVVAFVPETEITQLKKGDAVKVYVEAINQQLPATISQVNFSSQYSGSQYEVTVLLNEKGEGIRSGMHAYLQIEGQGKQGLSIPQQALVKKGQLLGVFVLNQKNEAKLRWIRTGRTHEGKVQILSGLKAGEKFVLKANGRIKDGVTIL